MKKLKHLLLYAGAAPEEWARIETEIDSSNCARLTIFTGISAGFLLVMTLLTLPMERYDYRNYLLPMLVCLGLLAAVRMAANNRWVLRGLLYLFIALLFGFGINVSTFANPDQTAGTFLAFLLTVPLLLILRPIENIILITIFDAVFSLSVLEIKTGSIRFTDIINGLIFAAVSMIISTFMTKTAVENFVIKDRLVDMARLDQLTRLQNRNAYEMSLAAYPARTRESLSCVYVDVNGLHELNNLRGHNAGDRMLQWVADALREQFGAGDTFRVGGDEFIAFAVDLPREQLEARTETFRRTVQQGGYHVSLGAQTQPAGAVDTYTLVKSAEKLMYADKEAFYQTTGRATR